MERDRIAFLADGHLRRDDLPRVETLVRAVDRLAERCGALFILGDLFEVWLGVGLAEPHVAPVREALLRARTRGVRTGYVEGNRDFGIGRGATAGMFDVVARREHVERFGERAYHLSHGDLVNGRDLQYRCWRAAAKGLLGPAALRLLPARRAVALGGWLESRLRPTNRRHKSYFPEEACRAWARARIARGADFVLVGHFHREVVLPLAAGGRSGTFVSLPFWHEEPRPLVFDRRGTRVEG